MTSLVTSLCFVALVVGYGGAGRALLPGRVRPALGTWVLLTLVGVPSLVQLAVPVLLDVLGRSAVEITRHHQYWRLVTSVVVQDGGLGGTVFNLVVLAVTVPVVERVWGSATTVVTFLVGGLLLNVAAVLIAYDGAGSSGATFALGCTVLVPAVLRRRGLGWVLVAGLATAGLLVLRDPHAAAVALGVVLGPALLALSRHRQRGNLESIRHD